MLDFHRADLARLAARDRLRGLAPQRGKDFASNDYLGLASQQMRDIQNARDQIFALGIRP